MAEVPAGVRAFLAGTAQLLTVVVRIVMVGYAVWNRRFRELLLVAASAIVAWIGMALIESQFDRAEPTETLGTSRSSPGSPTRPSRGRSTSPP